VLACFSVIGAVPSAVTLSRTFLSGSAIRAFRTSSNSRAAYTFKSGKQSYRSHGTTGVNCLFLKGLEGNWWTGIEPEAACPEPSIQVNFGQLPERTEKQNRSLKTL
jgi:hypothetical protein